MNKFLLYKKISAIILYSGLMLANRPVALSQSNQKIVSGYSHSIAIKSNGSLWVWGSNIQGQLGNGGNGDIWYPIAVSGMTSVKDAAGGYQHTVVVKTNGTVWAWGNNADGELGDGTQTQRTSPVQVPGLSGVANVAAGYYHSFAIKTNGTLYTWGKNDKGQLGNGNLFTTLAAFQVTTITGVSDAAGGELHSVALKTDGTVWTWGYNGEGELGNGTTGTTPQTAPAQISGGFTNGITAIAAGRYHTLALKNDGTLWAWGKNNRGQIGNDTTINQPTPIQILTNVTAVAAGEYTSLALKNDGTLWTWGENGNPNPQTTPIQIDSSTDWTAVSAGNYSLAFQSDNSVWGWGNNGNGQIGNGSNANSWSPVLSLFTFANKVNLPTFSPDGGTYLFPQRTKISCSTSQVVIHYTTNGIDPTENDPTIASGSKLKINNGTTLLKARAFKNGSAASDIKTALYSIGEKVICGYSHSIAIKPDSMLWLWGSNSNGQLANSSVGVNKLIPVKLTSITSLIDATAGIAHSLALKKDGTVWSWGANGDGQLGDASNTQRTSPVQVIGLSGITQIAAGYNHSLAIKTDGTLWAWGKNGDGQLGNGNTFSGITAFQLTGISGVIDVAGGEGHTVALKSDGTVWSWGRNYYGQLGEGTTTQRLTPVQVCNGMTNVVAIAAGKNHTIALKSDGTVWTWGRDDYGQLGNGDLITVEQPTPNLVNINNVIGIAAGEYHSVALKSDGTVWTWGKNTDGQLGDDTTINRTVPVQVLALAGVSSISAATHSLAITPLEEIPLYWAWGANYNGQLGDSSIALRNFRVLVHFPIDQNGNSIPDWQEINDSPFANDDQDGLPDWEELMKYGTDPHNFDSNVDGLADGINAFAGLAPASSDTDNDGVSNEQESLNGTNALVSDTDGDGVSDGIDSFPLDPSRSSLPPTNSSDHAPPVITLDEPPGAIIIQ